MKLGSRRFGTLPGLIAAAAALVATAAAAAAQNQIVNPDFAVDISGWSVLASTEYSVSHDPVMGASAPGSARVAIDSVGPLNHLVFQQCVTVLPGSNYDFGARFRFASGAAPPPTAALVVQWFNDGACVAPGNGAQSSFSSNTPDVWQLLSATNVTAPAGVGSAYVSTLLMTSGPGTSLTWFDDIYFGLNPTPVELQSFLVE